MSRTTLCLENRDYIGDPNEFRLNAAEHRCGNLLQILAILTRRRLRRAEGEEARETLGFVSELIDLMIALHGLRQGGEDDLVVVMHAMVSKWQRLCNGHIRILTDLEEGLDVPKSSQTVALLIAQVLVMDAIKHAFPNRRSGTIWIRLYQTPLKSVTLEVEDDAVGEAASGPETAGTAATRHVNTLVRDLAATLGGTMRRDQVRRGTGRCILVSWPV